MFVVFRQEFLGRFSDVLLGYKKNISESNAVSVWMDDWGSGLGHLSDYNTQIIKVRGQLDYDGQNDG